MTKYTTTQTFGPYNSTAADATVAVDANGGTLTIVHVMSDGTETAIENGVISVDSTVKVAVASGTFRATPTGSCAYSWAV